MKNSEKADGIEIRPGEFVAMDIRRCIEQLDRSLVDDAPLDYWERILTIEFRLNLFVCLDDLLQKASKATPGDLRVRFTDDVPISEGVNDVTDLINKARNAAVHISSPLRLAEPNLQVTSVQMGKVRFIKTPNLELNTDYENDVAIFYGKYRIYLFRHIFRAFYEVKGKLLPLIASPYNPGPDLPFGG